MKNIFHDGFDYHEVLKPIEPIREPEDPPIRIDNLELIQ